MHYKVLSQLDPAVKLTIFTNKNNIDLLKALGITAQFVQYQNTILGYVKKKQFLAAIKNLRLIFSYRRTYDFGVEPYFWRSKAGIETLLISKKPKLIKNVDVALSYSDNIRKLIPKNWYSKHCERTRKHHNKKNIVVIHAFSSETNRNLTALQIKQLVSRYSEGNKLYFCGTKVEVSSLSKGLRRFLDDQSVTLFSGNTFVDLVKLIDSSRLVIGTESFIVNLADARCVPTIGIYSNITYPNVWTLESPNSRIIRNEIVKCGPCFGKIEECGFYCVRSFNLGERLL
jgi:ADP-heptose:LPS heptosyltransferase